MLDIMERLKSEVLIGSGPTPTNAVRKGFNLTENASWWVVNHPDAYKELMQEWLDVGCDYIDAYTTAANRLRLKMFGLDDKAREVNKKVIELTKEVAGNNCYVIGILPRISMFLPPMGNASLDEAYESFVEQIVIASDMGVDLIRIPAHSIEEIELGVKAMKENSKLPMAGLLGLNPTPKGFRTMMGLDPTRAARKMEELGVDIVGVSCGGISYEETTAALKEMKAACNKYLYARPNAGVPQLVNGEVVHPGTPEEMSKEAPNWVEAGAKLIAGCCGTTPEHIARVIAALR